MGLADARAMYPHIDVVEADPQADRLLLEALADWCDRYTPLVAFDGADALFLDITGCCYLFGGEEALVAEMTHRFHEQGFDARIAVAATAGTAWAIARFHGDAVVPAGHEAQWLRPLPLAALRLDRAVCAALEGVGLRTVGAVMAAPRAPVARRFGKTPVLRLDQALGALDEALSPRMPVPELSAERHFAEPLMTLEDVEHVILLLAGTLQDALERRGEGALTFQLLLFRVDGAVSRLTVGLSRPTRVPERVAQLFHERLNSLNGSLDVGYGFDLVRLSVLSFGVLATQQVDLADDLNEAVADLALFVDRVAARLGRAVIRQPTAIASHLPERAFSLSPFASASDPEPHEAPLAAYSERPMRLLQRPEIVDVMAEVPDGPPLNFRWRRAHYRIARTEGPERISPEWWRRPLPSVKRKDGEEDTAYEERCRQIVAEKTQQQTRDYFRVEDGEGRRYWLFRQGLYGRSKVSPRWFLHGIFA